MDLLDGNKQVMCKCVFIVKYRGYRTIERHKQRLMVKGYAQTYEIDCRENFALMAKLNIIRILLFFVTNFDWPLQQFDMKNAFLYENLEEGYMEIPPGLEENFKRNRVC